MPLPPSAFASTAASHPSTQLRSLKPLEGPPLIGGALPARPAPSASTPAELLVSIIPLLLLLLLLRSNGDGIGCAEALLKAQPPPPRPSPTTPPLLPLLPPLLPVRAKPKQPLRTSPVRELRSC